jgi:UDPglucose 6-dehydrogenase
MKIAMVGTGYVGLVSAACFADVGNTVTCIDVDEAKLALLNAGGIPIHEAGLDEVVARNRAAGRITFSSDYPAAVSDAEVVFIAVGTPPREDGSADLLHVLAAAHAVGRAIGRHAVVVVKSTVPVGTCDKVRAVLDEELALRGVDWRIAVASNPEFLKEGAALDDFRRPDRIVVGTDDARAFRLLRALYAPYNRQQDRMIEMDTRSSEFTKYAANAMLAARISLMNELARVAECVGADIEFVRRGVGSDPRIGPNFLYAGVGYGGSCFPKDVRALVNMAHTAGASADILTSVQQVNEAQKKLLGTKIARFYGGALRGRTLAVWGLAFKPNTDDLREAPSLALIRELLAAGARVRAYDPIATEGARREFASDAAIEFMPSARAACEGAGALVLVTEWLEFRSPDFRWLASTLADRVIFDGRNLYEPSFVEECGLKYYGIGRGRAS